MEVNPIRLVRFVVRKYFGYIRNQQTREDYVSEGLLAYVKAFPKVKPDRTKQSTMAFLVVSVYNGIRQWQIKEMSLKRGGEVATCSLSTLVDFAEYEVEDERLQQTEESKDYVQSLLVKCDFTDLQRQLLHWYYWEGLSVQEIADQTQLTTKGVHDRLQLIRRKLRLTADSKPTKQRRNYYTLNGRTQCLTDWALEYGVLPVTARSRRSKGWSIEQILEIVPRARKRTK